MCLNASVNVTHCCSKCDSMLQRMHVTQCHNGDKFNFLSYLFNFVSFLHGYLLRDTQRSLSSLPRFSGVPLPFPPIIESEVQRGPSHLSAISLLMGSQSFKNQLFITSSNLLSSQKGQGLRI